MYRIELTSGCKRDFKKINKGDIQFIYDSLAEFAANFSSDYELSLMQSGKIKKLQGQKELLYRLRLRSYRVIYKKEHEKLLILVLHVTSREGAYK
ncbi:MAG: type II toxin-antitoxin system mRNA interferase toxin, RelE/StbE family [Epsilonproteobacteria bacterium]|nr:type II toxin-antitoxin system mRNA interferase toxin, RelE/StbE family [Campylobacterota bacterium]